MANTEKIKSFFKNIFYFLYDLIKKTPIMIYNKFVKISFWQRILYCFGALCLLLLIVSLLCLFIGGTLGSLLSSITFGSLLFVDILIIVLFYYDIKNSKGLEAFIREHNEVKEKFSRLTEKNELDIPWYFVLGEKGAGKTGLLTKSDVVFFRPKEQASPYIDTYFNKSALFWEYNIFEEKKSDSTDADESTKKTEVNTDFNTFLQFLKSRKNMLNLNGIILTISADELINTNKDYLVNKGKEFSEIINHIQQSLGICLPFYFVISKSDKICGFNEFFRNMDPKFYKQVFGWNNKLSSIGEKFSVDEYLEYMSEIVEKCKKQRFDFLHKFISESSKSEHIDTSAYYSFCENLMNISENAAALIESISREVYSNSKLYERKFNIVPLFVRGVYFVSTIQDNSYFDTLLYKEVTDEVELNRDESISAMNSSLFLTELIKNVLYKGSDISMRITSLRSSYKLKRITGMIMVLSGFALLLIITSVYWTRVFNYITYDKINLESPEIESLRSSLLYPTKDVEIVNARNNYLTLCQGMDKMRKAVEKTDKSLIDTSLPTLSIPYTKLSDTEIDERFASTYLTKIVDEWNSLSKMVDNHVKVIHGKKVTTDYYISQTTFNAYLDQYFMYWKQIIDEAANPEVLPWSDICSQKCQYWQIADSYRKTCEIIKNALSVYLDKAGDKLTADKKTEVERVLKSVSQTDADIANSIIQDKAVNMITYWEKIFNASSPVASRDIIYNTGKEIFFKNGIFQYTQKSEFDNYYCEYWQSLSVMFINSLGDALRKSSINFVSKLDTYDEFPLKTNWKEGNSLSQDDLNNLKAALDKYWPSDSQYPQGSVGRGNLNFKPEVDDALNKLKPQLEAAEMVKIEALHTVVNDMLPEHGKKRQVKVYLLPPGNGEQDNSGADFWMIMKMTQDKSMEQNDSVRTRIAKPEYLGALSYPSEGNIKFDFYRTLGSMNSSSPNLTLTINDVWGPLRLIFNGPSKPQNYHKDYWVTWESVKQVSDNEWISKITFNTKSGQNSAFYLKLEFQSNVGPIDKLTN